MKIDNIEITDNSIFSNADVVIVNESQKITLNNMRIGDVVYQTDGPSPGLYRFDGIAWIKPTYSTPLMQTNDVTLEINGSAGVVTSVCNKFGDVVLGKSDISGLDNVDNVSDADKPISVATLRALDNKANIAGAAFTGAISSTATITDGIGDVRSVPVKTKTDMYTLVANDNGALISITTGGVIVPPSVLTQGNTVLIYNDSNSTQPIICNTATAYIAGNNTMKTSVTLASRGTATILFTKNTEVLISGNVT
jgi:hypothetical protein